MARSKRGGVAYRPLEVRLWTKVRIDEDAEGCWQWIGALNDWGYGVIYDGKRLVYAHRLVYERLVRAVPEGYDVDHLCYNRGCVNPAHLEAVTHQENVRRSRERRRAARAAA